MSAGDIIVLCAVLLLLSVSVIWYFIRKKRGKGGCGGSCSSCPYSSGKCEKHDKNESVK